MSTGESVTALRKETGHALPLGDHLRYRGYEKHFWRAFKSAQLSASRDVFLKELVSCPERKDVAFLFCGRKCMTSEIDLRTLAILEEAIPEMIIREGAYVRLCCSVLPGVASCSLVDIPIAATEDGWEIIPRQRRPTDSVHFGYDTFVMLEEIKRVTTSRKFCRGLDLCCGSGALTFPLSSCVNTAIGVDTNTRAIEMARLSSRLNSSVPEFVNGDVRCFENSMAFDLIVCNPPYVPVPPGFDYPDYGNGGPDGIQIVSVVIERIVDLLAVNGHALIMYLDAGKSYFGAKFMKGFTLKKRVVKGFTKGSFLCSRGIDYQIAHELSDDLYNLGSIDLCVVHLKRDR